MIFAGITISVFPWRHRPRYYSPPKSVCLTAPLLSHGQGAFSLCFDPHHLSRVQHLCLTVESLYNIERCVKQSLSDCSNLGLISQIAFFSLTLGMWEGQLLCKIAPAIYRLVWHTRRVILQWLVKQKWKGHLLYFTEQLSASLEMKSVFSHLFFI